MTRTDQHISSLGWQRMFVLNLERKGREKKTFSTVMQENILVCEGNKFLVTSLEWVSKIYEIYISLLVLYLKVADATQATS